MNAPSPFIEGTSLQFAWDNTSLSLLQTCPYKYKLTIIEGWKSKSKGLHLKFGGHFATAMEHFYKHLAEGMSYDDAVDAVVWEALKDTVEYVVADETTGLTQCVPWESDDTKKNRQTLIRSIIWYFETYRDDPARTVTLSDGSPAVELSFKFESGIQDPFGGEYLLTGHLDRVVDFDGTLFVMDQKTTGSGLGAYYFAQYDLDNQMSQYTYAGRVVFDMPISGVIIDAAQILVGSTGFSRGITMRTKDQLDEWHSNTAQWLKLNEGFAERGVWPQNRMSCNNYGGCVFKDICNKSTSVREQFLETHFERKHWNPLEVR